MNDVGARYPNPYEIWQAVTTPPAIEHVPVVGIERLALFPAFRRRPVPEGE